MRNITNTRLIWLLSILGIFSLMAMPSLAEVVVIVNPANVITRVSVSDIKARFLDKKKTVGGNAIMPVVQRSGATRDRFNERVLKKSNRQLKAYWARLIFSGKGTPPKILKDDAEVKSYVASTRNAMGYIDSNGVDVSVKVILTIK